ncbi:hypothetical protein Pint_09769 [Pistacia integerrima]|uniref:Uncharacterized protein n=1 Tax=Pistacia integerrima TaxID=434235 RepID=A0ACC0XDK5_9ROSI|nr:hypothetical protein Pint_09769 [Pistacia integerrima]
MYRIIRSTLESLKLQGTTTEVTGVYQIKRKKIPLSLIIKIQYIYDQGIVTYIIYLIF